jgi:Protein of unknown function (DUF1501)
MAYGATDDFGYRAAVDPVHPHDLNATLLHLLGLDHTRLTYHCSGRDFRLTDVHGKVVRAASCRSSYRNSEECQRNAHTLVCLCCCFQTKRPKIVCLELKPLTLVFATSETYNLIPLCRGNVFVPHGRLKGGSCTRKSVLV